MPTPAPVPIGLRPSFGFGDRLGLATSGHAIAAREFPEFVPVFAQQSVREIDRTARTPDAVLSAAQIALEAVGWEASWGADADHLKTRDDVERYARAGYTFYTIDPSEFVDDSADAMGEIELVRAAEKNTNLALRSYDALYMDTRFSGDGYEWRFDRERLYRAVVKYGSALAHTARMANWIRHYCLHRDVDIEVSVDETATPTSPLEHLFIALELRRRQIGAVSVALRFVGEFEKGIDYKGELGHFEESLRQQVAIASTFGPYKLSVHSGSDKFSIYPILGRVCGDLLHVKTAGTSYLEALRAVGKQNVGLFREIAAFALLNFAHDRATYHLSADVSRLPPPHTCLWPALENRYLSTADGRQLLHVTYGSVLTRGRTAKGQPFRAAIVEALQRDPAVYEHLLAEHFRRHLSALRAG